MKTLAIILLSAVSFVNAIFSDASAQIPEKLYQKALVKEEGEGALLEAISIYNQVADDQNAEKTLQAKALLHIGMCYEKLGKQEAVKAYQRVVSNFPEQKNEVTIAMERLSKLSVMDSPKEITIKQINPATDYTCSISSDGVYLAQTDWGTGNVQVRNLKTGEKQMVTNDATWITPMEYAESTLISPDGKRIAYKWFNKSEIEELRVVKMDSPVPTILYTGIKGDYLTPELWFPDGRNMIFQKYNTESRIWQLFSVNTGSREIKLLKENAPDRSFQANVSLSPDGKQLAFDFANPSDERKYDINSLSLEKKDESSLVRHPAHDRLLGWLPGRMNFFLPATGREQPMYGQ